MLNFNLSCGGKLEELINVSKTTSIALFFMLGFGNLAQLLRNIAEIIIATNRGRNFFVEVKLIPFLVSINLIFRELKQRFNFI